MIILDNLNLAVIKTREMYFIGTLNGSYSKFVGYKGHIVDRALFHCYSISPVDSIFMHMLYKFDNFSNNNFTPSGRKI